MKKTFITLLLAIGVLGACTAEGIAESAANTDNTNGTQGGTSQQTPTSEKYDFVITPKNVTGDFRTFLQSVFSSHNNILIKKGVYEIELIDGVGVRPKNGSKITFEEGARIKVKRNKLDVYCVIDLRGRKDITLNNPDIEGDKYEHLSKTGEWCYGINVAECSNIIINNAKVTKMWGDGIYLRECENIKIYSPFLSDNRRQGLSILSGKDIEIHDLVAENTGGTNPGYGIDIEPDWNGDSVTGLRIYRPTVRNNGNGTFYTGGICLSTVSSHKLKSDRTTYAYSYFDVEIFDPVFEGDALMISAYSDYVKGSIKVHNPTFKNSKNAAAFILNHVSNNFTTEITNPKFIDCVQSTKNSIYLAPILFVCDELAKKTTGTKNVKIINPIIEATNNAVYKIAAVRNATSNIFKEDLNNVVIENLTVRGYEASFYNFSGHRSTISNLHPTFSLNIKEQSVLPTLKPNSIITKIFDGMAADFTESIDNPVLYLSDDIPVTETEFYYKNSAKNKTPLKLLFGTNSLPSKVYMGRWGTERFSGIEIPYGGFVRIKKNKANHWVVTEASSTVSAIK